MNEQHSFLEHYYCNKCYESYCNHLESSCAEVNKMWLSDFEEAIKNVKAILGDCCFMQVQWSCDGSKLIFYMNTFVEPNDGYLVYFRKTHRLEKWYGDTWKNPEHKEVIYEGDE